MTSRVEAGNMTSFTLQAVQKQRFFQPKALRNAYRNTKPFIEIQDYMLIQLYTR